MTDRREFLVVVAGAATLMVGAPILGFANEAAGAKEQQNSGKTKANLAPNRPIKATAIAQVLGSGLTLTGAVVEYERELTARDIANANFAVMGYETNLAQTSKDKQPDTNLQPATDQTAQGDKAQNSGANPQNPKANLLAQNEPIILVISRLVLQDSLAPLEAKFASKKAAKTGKFIFIHFAPSSFTNLVVKAPHTPRPAGQNGPGNAGERKENAPHAANITLKIYHGKDMQTLESSETKWLIADKFKQHEFADVKSGKRVRYNLFTPPHLKDGESYPLVLFMHDAGVTGAEATATLIQGNGATAWASASIQAKQPCFVLAPQFDEIIADDDSRASEYLDATINLINDLAERLPIDRARMHTTGQSGGGMMSIAMNVKYPNFFASSYLVACQWDASVVAPMAKNRLFIVVSADDAKAYPGQSAIVAELEKHGAKVARATWRADWSEAKFKAAFDKLVGKNANANVYFVVFEKGSVFKDNEEFGIFYSQTSGQSAGGGHVNTWKYAYNITPILRWILS